jgi:hypothetical protein
MASGHARRDLGNTPAKHCRGLSYPQVSPSHLLAMRGLQSRVSDNAMIAKPEARRFLPPSTVEETDACFIVKDHTALAGVRLLRGGARPSRGDETDDARRGVADRC